MIFVGGGGGGGGVGGCWGEWGATFSKPSNEK